MSNAAAQARRIDVPQMQTGEVVDVLKQIVADIFRQDVQDFDAETRLFNGGASLNSTQMIELTLAFERHFEVEFEPELLTPTTFRTFGTLAEAILACRAGT